VKSKTSRVVTPAIICLTALFAGAVFFSYIRRDSEPSRTAGPGGPERPGGQPSGGAPPGQGGPGTRNATVVRVTAVVLGTIENRVVINGDVIPRSEVSLYPSMAGKLTEVRFRVGDRVSRGDIVAVVDPSRPGEFYSPSPVLSTISGTVVSAPLNPGDTVSVQTPVYVVGDFSELAVETFVPERFSAAVERGMTATVSFDALPEERFAALVDEVSPVLDSASRTLRIRLRFAPGRIDPRIRAGMFATVSLVTNSRINVPVIPRNAAINTYGSWIVFTAEGGRAERREITLGLESEEFVEVIRGLDEGELVVTAGQNFLSDHDPVRVVE
jgi:multidrug efflux pump subunit AcrA (membrane-fusion protein)